MTFVEIERFYEQDQQLYTIIKNQDFQLWLKRQIDKGYNAYTDMDDYQQFIDFVTTWYELKYPSRELEKDENDSDIRFINLPNLTEQMTFEQLLYRLPHTSLCLMESSYRGGWGIKNVYDENGKFLAHAPQIFIALNHINPKTMELTNRVLLHADAYDGTIERYSIKKLNMDATASTTLDELLQQLIQSKRIDIDYQELEKAVNNHNIDQMLRKKLLELVALKLLYSRQTFPEHNYQRAQKFIQEFNDKFPELQLSTTMIDDIMNKDYKVDTTMNQSQPNSISSSKILYMFPRFNHKNEN